MNKKTCSLCSIETDEIDEHHIIPKEKGGSNNVANKIKICRDCHYKIHHPEWKDGDLEQFKEEFQDSIENNIFSDGYGIIPRKVMTDESLPAGAKLLYCELSSLCASKGYCWATNRYLAELFHVSTATISDWITKLEKYLVFENRTSFKRKIWVHNLKFQPSRKLDSYKKKSTKNHQENLKHNNIINIITNTSVSIIDIENFQKAIFVLELKELTDNQNLMIAKLIEKYPSRDYEFQAQKCKDWWFTHPRTGWKKPLLAFSNWLDRSKADDGIVAKKQAERMKIEQDKRDYVGPVDPESKKKVDAIKAQIRERFRMKK